MKTFKLIGMALLAIVMSVNFTACSSDDDEPKEDTKTPITGVWKIIDSSEDLFITDENVAASFLEFTSSNEITPLDSKQEFLPGATDGKTFYQITGSTLQIDYNCSGSFTNHKTDDYTKGSFTINGKRLSYNYFWFNSNGSQEGSESNKLILEKVR